MTPDELKTFRSALEQRRADLSDLSSGSFESRREVELDQQRVGRLSRMDAMQQQAMAIATDRRRAAELMRIEAALARIEAGDYGYCVSCDEPIDPKRLTLDPSIPTCLACARGAA
ncbi:MAG: TraR/DksA family transcriptional regulator [Alphaproteobacteria bacterium]